MTSRIVTASIASAAAGISLAQYWEIPTAASIGALALAVLCAAWGRASPSDAFHAENQRREDLYRYWLDAWRAERRGGTPAAAEELETANRLLALSAADRVVRAVEKAFADDLSAAAAGRVVLEMRRSLGLPSLTLQPQQIERLIAPRRAADASVSAAPASVQPPSRPQSAPASFLG